MNVKNTVKQKLVVLTNSLNVNRLDMVLQKRGDSISSFFLLFSQIFFHYDLKSKFNQIFLILQLIKKNNFFYFYTKKSWQKRIIGVNLTTYMLLLINYHAMKELFEKIKRTSQELKKAFLRKVNLPELSTDCGWMEILQKADLGADELKEFIVMSMVKPFGFSYEERKFLSALPGFELIRAICNMSGDLLSNGAGLVSSCGVPDMLIIVEHHRLKLLHVFVLDEKTASEFQDEIVIGSYAQQRVVVICYVKEMPKISGCCMLTAGRTPNGGFYYTAD